MQKNIKFINIFIAFGSIASFEAETKNKGKNEEDAM